MPKRYRKKPVVIEALQLSWGTWNEMCGFVGVGKLTDGKAEGCCMEDGKFVPMDHGGALGLQIPTLEGFILGRENDWIIKGVGGEFYPCKPDIFDATYEPVSEGSG